MNIYAVKMFFDQNTDVKDYKFNLGQLFDYVESKEKPAAPAEVTVQTETPTKMHKKRNSPSNLRGSRCRIIIEIYIEKMAITGVSLEDLLHDNRL